MMLLFIIMLPPIIVPIILVLIVALFYISYKINYCVKGDDFYKAILYSFLIPGLGLWYIDCHKKAIIWHMAQYVFTLFSFILSNYTNYEHKYYGIILAAPFILQLYVTAIEYKRKYGDINKIF